MLGARRGEADRDRALLCRQPYDNFANQSAVRSGLAGHVQGISPRWPRPPSSGPMMTGGFISRAWSFRRSAGSRWSTVLPHQGCRADQGNAERYQGHGPGCVPYLWYEHRGEEEEHAHEPRTEAEHAQLRPLPFSCQVAPRTACSKQAIGHQPEPQGDSRARQKGSDAHHGRIASGLASRTPKVGSRLPES